MFKLIFGGIVLLFVLGGVFFLGFVAGTTATPLSETNSAAAALPTSTSVVNHA